MMNKIRQGQTYYRIIKLDSMFLVCREYIWKVCGNQIHFRSDNDGFYILHVNQAKKQFYPSLRKAVSRAKLRLSEIRVSL
jgi:hypothetical protein